jgi:CrcB protein
MPTAVIPLGTFTVNVTGSFLLGLLAGLGTAVPGAWGALLGTGFCGALTTWSTFAFQTVDAGSRRIAALNVAATLVVGFGAVLLGRALGAFPG